MRKVTLIPGDGIGPEISKSVTDIFEAAGVEVEFEIENAGEKVYNETGELIPESLYKSIEKVKCIFSFLFSNSYTFTIVKIIR